MRNYAMMNGDDGSKLRMMRRAVSLMLAGGLIVTAACSMDSIVGKNDLPSTVADPAKTKTADGALAAYKGALVQFRDAMGNGGESYVVQTALLTDETWDPGKSYGGYGGDPSGKADSRILPEGLLSEQFPAATYRALQQTRAQAGQARGLLHDYYPTDKQNPLIAHMYAVEAYAELMLAEGYCSGIPLSTLDYDGDYTFQPGSKTVEVLNHVIAKFDSAIAIAGDSARVINLARVGKARALQQLGNLAEAAQAVSAVPPDFQYNFHFSVAAKACGLWHCAYGGPIADNVHGPLDREGVNGLPFVSEHDGRLPTLIDTGNTIGYLNIPQNHAIRLSSGVEAQLIRAEAELAANDPNWLVRLNALRTTCTDAATCPTPAPAGIGGVAGLPPLSEPATMDARIDLVFRERAYWMYLTGHRQGDLRRLVREYHRPQSAVYPIGLYNTVFKYGSDVTFPVPQSEQKLNPQYHGCVNRDA